MSTFVFDPLYIKTIEKEIGRKLDELDLEAIKYGEPIFLQKQDRVWASYLVPFYKFPHDLMVKEADLALVKNTGFFDFSFNIGPVKEVRLVD